MLTLSSIHISMADACAGSLSCSHQLRFKDNLVSGADGPLSDMLMLTQSRVHISMLMPVLFRPKETQVCMHSNNTKRWKQQPPAKHHRRAAPFTTSRALCAGTQAPAHRLEHTHAHAHAHATNYKLCSCSCSCSCLPSHSHQLRFKDELISGPNGPLSTSANAQTVKLSHFHADACALQTKRDTSVNAQQQHQEMEAAAAGQAPSPCRPLHHQQSFVRRYSGTSSQA